MDASDLHTAVMIVLANGGSTSDEYDAAADVLDTIFADENREALISAMVHLGVAEQPKLGRTKNWSAAFIEKDGGVFFVGPDFPEPTIDLYRLDGHFEP